MSVFQLRPWTVLLTFWQQNGATALYALCNLHHRICQHRYPTRSLFLSVTSCFSHHVDIGDYGYSSWYWWLVITVRSVDRRSCQCWRCHHSRYHHHHRRHLMQTPSKFTRVTSFVIEITQVVNVLVSSIHSAHSVFKKIGIHHVC